MGYRRGPALGPPSVPERHKIRRSLEFRHLFRLNPSVLLIRRLLRAHGHGIDPAGGGTGVPLAALELRDLAFRSRVEGAIFRLTRFQRLCAGRTSAGLYLFDRREGVSVATRFTGHLGARRRQMLRRFEFGPVLRVLPARFSLRDLTSVQRRIEDDEAFLAAHGIEVGATDIDVARNRVGVELRRGGTRGRRLMLRRYRHAVEFD
jgi:hypothetical protein